MQSLCLRAVTQRGYVSMKSSTADLLDLHVEAKAEPPRSGFTGALELYDELINFLGLTPETQPQAAAPRETTDATTAEPAAPPAETAAITSEPDVMASQAAPPDQAAGVAVEETVAANSGALSNSEDVIRITGMLTGAVAAKTADSVMVACGDCGEASDSGEMFCIHCGGLLEEPASRAEAVTPSAAEFCDDCGAMVERDEIFCPSCGSVMANA